MGVVYCKDNENKVPTDIEMWVKVSAQVNYLNSNRIPMTFN